MAGKPILGTSAFTDRDCLNNVPGEGAVHIVVPSPLERMGMSVTVNTLNGKWASFKDNLAPLVAAIEQKRTA